MEKCVFIHLGENIVIEMKDVVAIIDGDLLKDSPILNEFVNMNHDNKKIVEISNGTAKSIVVTKNKVYFSPLSTVTLKRRSQYVSELEIISE